MPVTAHVIAVIAACLDAIFRGSRWWKTRCSSSGISIIPNIFFVLQYTTRRLCNYRLHWGTLMAMAMIMPEIRPAAGTCSVSLAADLHVQRQFHLQSDTSR